MTYTKITKISHLKTMLVFMRATSGELDKNQHYKQLREHKHSKKSPTALKKRNFENNSAGHAENSVFYPKCQFSVRMGGRRRRAKLWSVFSVPGARAWAPKIMGPEIMECF